MAAPQNAARRAALVKGASKAKIKANVNLQGCTGCEVCIAVCPVPNCILKFGVVRKLVTLCELGCRFAQHPAERDAVR